MTEQNELVVVKPANIPALFEKDGCDSLLKRIKEEVGKFEGDISTTKGRKEIASMAMKVAKSKVYLEGLGKDLVTGIKEQAKVIDAERKKVREELDLLKEEVRQPLTDWEDAEKKKVTAIEERIRSFENPIEEFDTLGSVGLLLSSAVEEKLERLKGIVIDETFEEFELAATKAKEAALTQLEAKFIVLQNAEKEKAEAERLEKERLAKEQKEREEKIARDAAEKATKEAKAKAKEKDAKAKQAIIDAKAATEKAKREKKESEDKAKQDKKEAAEQAERDRVQAVEDEKQRQADQIKTDKEAEEKRQANKRHRNKIHKEAKGSMMEHGMSEEDATIFVTRVKDGLVKHITINY